MSSCSDQESSSHRLCVHELRPSDINLVAAFGDSITSGNGLGAEDLIEVALNNRGESWSVGGDKSLEEGVITLANILRKFNPDLKGYSVDYCFEFEEEAGLNVARMGNRVRHMGEQAEDMIYKLQTDPRFDMAYDWKLITILIGGNDLCGYCKDRENRSPQRYKELMAEGIDLIYQLVPRAMVQLVPMFDVSPLSRFSDGLACDLLHEQFCSCALNATTRRELRGIQLGYYNVLKELAEDPKYDGRDDFTVVLQPYMRDLRPPENADGSVDNSWFSPDCFHPGRTAHQMMAIGLWNTMLEQVGQKTLTFQFDGGVRTLECPSSESPYIFTKRNGGTMSSPVRPQLMAVDEGDGTETGSGFTQTHGIVAGVVGGVVLVAMAMLVAGVVYRRRKRAETEKMGNVHVDVPQQINVAYDGKL